MTSTLLLVRHGETDWNREGRVQGHSDVPLNDTGRAQARALAARLAAERVDAVYSSDLRRARDTAQEVARASGHTVTTTPHLREKHFGSWEGLTRDEILSGDPDALSGPWGDGETRDEMADRVLHALRGIAARHEGETVVVVSHGGPLRAVQRTLGMVDDEPIVNCHVLRLVVDDGRFYTG
jgi:broad specificity phosphatase PhoE